MKFSKQNSKYFCPLELSKNKTIFLFTLGENGSHLYVSGEGEYDVVKVTYKKKISSKNFKKNNKTIFSDIGNKYIPMKCIFMWKSYFHHEN